MRIVGPNCMGLINTDPHVKLNATFALTNPAHGNISFISQSGALGLGILEYAKSMNIGFSSFVSVGNRSDIASTDMLQYWEQDPATRVILLYLESFDNTEIFSRVSRRILTKKPILAIKGGSTPEGSKASRSHTGAMATSDVVSDALFREAGIVMVDSIGELFDSAILLANQPVPKGKRVAILTNGGGPGILAADACAHNGLTVPELSAATLDKIKSAITRDIHISNPIDLTAGISPDEFEAVLKILAADPGNDAILTIYVPPAGQDISALENAISNASPLVRENGKPLLSCFLGMSGKKGKTMEGHFVPYYLFPEDATAALTNAVKYQELRVKETGSVPEFKDIDRGRSRQIINEVLMSSPQRPIWIDNNRINELFKCYGINYAETVAAATPEEAAATAVKTGFPVVVKLNSATITHKTEVGGVVLHVKSTEEAKAAFNQIKTNLAKLGREKEMEGVTVQRQVTEGAEVIIGVSTDRMLGHVMMFGLGGIYAELIKDTAIRLHPLTDIKAAELINSVKMAQLLKGFRGMKPYDVKSLEDLLLRISALVEDNPQITEMDLNPVKVQTEGKGYWVVDARIMVQ
jgi:acetyltransferase